MQRNEIVKVQLSGLLKYQISDEILGIKGLQFYQFPVGMGMISSAMFSFKK